jgi:hypothetical protein
MSNFQRRIVQDNHTSHSAQGTLTNASAAILTAGDDEVLTIDSIFLTEYSGNARTVTLRHVDSGDVDDGTANFMTDLALAPKETFHLEGPIVLTDGAALKALASANTSVNYLISYRKEV